MKEIGDVLRKKVKILAEVLARYNSRLQKPEGTLKVCSKKSGNYFYLRKGGELTYMKHEDVAAARRLVQRELEWKSVPEIRHDIEVLSEAVEIADSWPWERILNRMSPAKRELARLPVKSDAEMEAEWLSRDRRTLEFRDGDRIYQSASGQYYRSKSEAMLADMFEESGLVFVYEQEIYLRGIGSVYPDFTLFLPGSGCEVIWEHFGMMDNPEYANRAIKKIRDYAACGFTLGDNFICTFESQHVPLDKAAVAALICGLKSANE